MQGSTNSSGRRLATAALLGVGSALTFGAAAHADGVTGAKVGNTESTGTVHLQVDVNGEEKPLAANTGLIDLKTGTDSDANLLQTYCIQLDTQLDHEETYDEKNWSDLKPAIPDDNLHEVWWVLDHSYPTLSLSSLDSLPGISNLSKKEAVEGTQAAVWNLVDPSGKTYLDTANTHNDANVVALYNYLVQTAGLHKADSGTPQLSLSITPDSKTGAQPGDKVGPFTLDSSDHSTDYISLAFGTGNDAPPAGSKIVDSTGAEIPANALLKDGDQFWVQIPGGLTGSGSFTVKASGQIPEVENGRVFMTHDGKVSQNLILGGSGDVNVDAAATVSWSAAPPTSPPSSSPSTTPTSEPSSSPSTSESTTPATPTTSPTGGLAHTGAGSSVAFGEAALALVAAGGGLVLYTRRPRRGGSHQ